MGDDKRISTIERKQLAAKSAYAKSKAEQEHALLRLRPGSLARIDQARAGMGMTRSAYIESLLEATQISPATSPSLTAAPSAPARSIGDEFEALFGGGA